MNQILHILRYKIIAFIRLNSKMDLPSLVKNIGSGLIYFGFALGAYLFTLQLIYFLLIQIKVGLFLLHELLSMILFIFFLSVNVGNIIVSYSTLYKSSEVVYYFSKPVSPSKIFTIKFLDNFFYSSTTLLMIMFSVMIGYAAYFHLTILDILFLIFFNLLPFIISAGSLGVIVLMLVINTASKFGFKKVLGILIVLYGLIVLAFFKINSPVQLVNTVMSHYPFLEKDNYLYNIIPPVINYLPNNWLSKSAFWLVSGDFSKSIITAIYQVILAFILFSLALQFGKKWYFATWLNNQAINSKYIAKIKTNIPFFSLYKKSFLKPQTESIIKKDLLVFMREPSQVIHISILLFLIAVFISSVSGIKYYRLGEYVLITTIYLSIYLFILLLVSTLALRFIFPLISLEGMSFWKIKSAPIKNSFLIKNKIMPLGFLILFVGQGLSLFANIRLDVYMMIIFSFITLVTSVSIVSINYGMGIFFVNYKEKNPIRISSSQGASISFLFTIGYMLFVVALLFEPLLQIFLSIRMNKPIVINSLLISLLPITIISFLVTYFFIKSGLNSLKKDF